MSRAYTAIIAPEAVAEVVVIATWWNENRPAAPRLFQTELDRAVLRLAERPEIGPKVRVRGRPGNGAATSCSTSSTRSRST